MLGAWASHFTSTHCPGAVTPHGKKQVAGAGASSPQQRALLGHLAGGTKEGCSNGDCGTSIATGLESRDQEGQWAEGMGAHITGILEEPLSRSWDTYGSRMSAMRHLTQTLPSAKSSRAAGKIDVPSMLTDLIGQSCQGVLIVPHGLGAGAGGEDLYLAAMAGEYPAGLYCCCLHRHSVGQGHCQLRPCIGEVCMLMCSILSPPPLDVVHTQTQSSVPHHLAGAGVCGPAQPLSTAASRSFCRYVCGWGDQQLEQDPALAFKC